MEFLSTFAQIPGGAFLLLGYSAIILFVVIRTTRSSIEAHRMCRAQAVLFKRLKAEYHLNHMLAVKQAAVQKLADEISEESESSFKPRELAAKQLKLQQGKEDLARLEKEIRHVFPQLLKNDIRQRPVKGTGSQSKAVSDTSDQAHSPA